jgi:hypothetical protein
VNYGNNWNPKQGNKEFFGMLRNDSDVILSIHRFRFLEKQLVNTN